MKGAGGSSTGNRLLVPADLFVAEEKPRFTEVNRENAVMLEYPSAEQDAVRFKLPAGVVVESAVTPEEQKMDAAGYSVSSKQTPTSVTSFRNVTIGRSVFAVKEYAELRGFYGKLGSADQQQVVLTRAATASSANAGTAAAESASKQ